MQLHYALVPHRGHWDDAGISDISEVDLRGVEVSRPSYSNYRLTVQMPRFGIRTYRLRIK
ncbi:MAG: hypothetical protein K6G92_09895 [Bacteroidaceae bacterium]|nr:hypothetical protein [Bacteroidaceae bacterium]